MLSIQTKLTRQALDGTITLPDTLFVMNAYDKPLCLAGACAAPLFSFNKPWLTGPEDKQANSTSLRATRTSAASPAHALKDTSGDSSSEGSSTSSSVSDPVSAPAATSPQTGSSSRAFVKGTYDDVLFPVLNHQFDQVRTCVQLTSAFTCSHSHGWVMWPDANLVQAAWQKTLSYPSHPVKLVNFPWENKTHTAFMRAGIYAAMDAQCGRVRWGLAPSPSALALERLEGLQRT